MKKMLLLIVVLALAVFVGLRLFSGKTEKPEGARDRPLSISKNSDAFNASFERLLGNYDSLQRALVEWDSVKADQAAVTLSLSADSLPLQEIKADSSIVMTARSMVAAVSGEAKGLTGEAGIAGKRRSFNMLTDELYNLIRAVRYDRETIYHIKCPMAFGDSEEGYWLSNSSRVVNPYLGTKHPIYKSKMIGCGEVTDSLDFAKK